MPEQPDHRWRRSSASIPFNDCVEILADQDKVRVRDSKGKLTTELGFAPEGWAAFLTRLRR